MERDVAEKAFEMMIKTWADTGVASDAALQAGIDESLKGDQRQAVGAAVARRGFYTSA
jgi:hypothetical protein